MLGLWDVTVSYVRDNGEQVSKNGHFVINDSRENGYFISEGFYWTGSEKNPLVAISGNVKNGYLVLHDIFKYEGAEDYDDAICQGTYKSDSYDGLCNIGSQVDYGWKDFKVQLRLRKK